jgi:hypothetical protein
MTVSGYSSTSRSLEMLVASSRGFLKLLVTRSIMRPWRGIRRIALQQAWTEAPAKNQGRCKQKSKKKKQSHKEVINTRR